MSLRSKIVIILFTVVVMYAALDRVIQEVVVFKSFEALEEAQAERDLRRVVQAIQSEVRHLGVRCDDWATWDDTYRFIDDSRRAEQALDVADRTRFGDRARDYIVSNLVPECFHKNNLNLLYICDSDGKVVWGRGLDLEGDRDFGLHDFPSERLAPDHPLLVENTRILIENLPGSFTSDDLRKLFLPFGGVRSAEVALDPMSARAQSSGSVRMETPEAADAALSGLSNKEVAGHAIRLKASEAPGGLLMTERGPMLVSAKPVLNNQRQGPARGTVIMGRLLSPALVAALARQTGVDFAVWRVQEEDLAAAEQQVLNEVTAQAGEDAHVIRVSDEDTLHAYTTYSDIRQAPALLIRANIVRDITARGATAARYALLSTVVAGILILSVLLQLLQRAVLKPIAALTEQAVQVGRSEDFTRKLNLDRADEIGTLSREFDAMMEKLADSRAALVKAARAAGMSEIATGVLHNVGNVLNSVNVSATLVADKARSAGLDDLKGALRAVQESTDDLVTFLQQDPRGKHLYPLLKSLAADLESERETIAREAKTLTQGIEHIKELIQSQQSHAGRSGVLECISLKEEIEVAVNMTGLGIQGRGIEVVREYDDLPPCAVDRHRLKEILVNVIQNAWQSVQAREEGTRPQASADGTPNAGLDGSGAATSRSRLTLRLKKDDRGRVRIEVADNGLGIPRENLSRIFTHGFTTKKTGHGFGLHASANAAKEMGGALTVHSAGLGTGATFILDLPVEKHQGAGART